MIFGTPRVVFPAAAALVLGGGAVTVGLLTASFAVGALLFAASDVLLVLNQFGKQTYRALRPLHLSLYYLGQVCLCLTIALMR